MLLELLGASHSLLSQEDLQNSTELFSCLPETASTMTLLHMLQDTPTASVISPDIILQQEHNFYQHSCCSGALVADHELCCKSKSSSCRPRRLEINHEQASSSVTSDPSCTLVSAADWRTEAAAVQDQQGMQYSHATLDEGSRISSAPALQGSTQLSCAGAAPESVTSDELRYPTFEPEGAARPTKRRKHTRACNKNSEKVASQRLTHITVERNRRKQMKEHLRVLRSLIPASYTQRGDQASIVGGAIEFVKDLEQVLHSLRLQKQRQCWDGSLYL